MPSVAAVSDVTDGPVLTPINKRIRNLRKKLNRIAELEESVAQGKSVHKEQEDLLNSKPSIVAVVDELEKLRQPISVAVDAEIKLAIKRKSKGKGKKIDVEKGTAPFKAEDVEDLLNLIYFGSLFDVKSRKDLKTVMLTRTHERISCLSYNDDSDVMLGESDLDLISLMSSLLILRPIDSNLSHQNALQSCIEHAKLWIAKSEQAIAPDTNVTYAALREKLGKIMRSDYFKITPEMKTTADVAAEAARRSVLQVPVETSTQVEEQKHKVNEEINKAIKPKSMGMAKKVDGENGSLSKTVVDNVENETAPCKVESVKDLRSVIYFGSVPVETSTQVEQKQKENGAKDCPKNKEADQDEDGFQKVQLRRHKVKANNSMQAAPVQTKAVYKYQNFPNRSNQNPRGGSRHIGGGGAGGGDRRGLGNGRGGGQSGGRGGPYQNGRNQHPDGRRGSVGRANGNGNCNGSGGYAYNNHQKASGVVQTAQSS
ncbi:uncharacterized protein [Rutidosis leptorrhynchoides]|uniref:uncharacterized protein n=1 Tax=Rutidosis leptorrhynchoides TaxID=125765 RepID=UPI003A991DFE